MSAESGLSVVFNRSRLQPTCKFSARQFYCRVIVFMIHTYARGLFLNFRYLSTARKHSANVIQSLHDAFLGQPFMPLACVTPPA
jgi:hypothetical protein